MLQEYIAQGSTVEEAIQAGCEKLGVDSFDVTTEILELPKKGFFGKLKSPAKVKITYDDGVKESKKPTEKKPQNRQAASGKKQVADKKPQKAAEQTENKEVKKPTASKPVAADLIPEADKKPTDPGDIDKKLEISKEYLRNILSAMDINQIEFEVQKSEDGAVINLVGENLGVIIGRRGETLDSIQYLVSLAANRIDSGYYRIAIDCGDFRAKRRQTLIELAEKIAQSVIKNGRSTTLEPMNPYERRIIHAVISEKDGVVSRSVGDEPYRKVVISVPGAKPYRRSPRGGDSKYQRRQGDRGRGGSRPRREQSEQPKPDPNREKLDDASDGSLYSKIEF